MRSVYNLLKLLPIATILTGCLNSNGLSVSCQQQMGTYPVFFSGMISGLGEISLSNIQSQDGAVDILVRISDPEVPDRIFMQVRSVGTCTDGTIRATFNGNSASPLEGHKVIGGNFVGIFEPKVMDVAFGRWEMNIINTKLRKDASIYGYWQELTGKEKFVGSQEPKEESKEEPEDTIVNTDLTQGKS